MASRIISETIEIPALVRLHVDDNSPRSRRAAGHLAAALANALANQNRGGEEARRTRTRAEERKGGPLEVAAILRAGT